MQYPIHQPTRSQRLRRPGRTVAAAAALSASALALTGCVDAGDPAPTESASPTDTASPTASAISSESASPSESVSETPTSSASGSATESPTETPEAGAIDLDQELPSEDLEFGHYDGPPRRIADVNHLSCVEALAGEADVPEMEPGPDEELSLYSQLGDISVTEGWKLCPPQGVASFGVPASFSVEAEPGERSLSTLRIFDADGQRIGGLMDVGSGSDAGETELIKVIEIEEVQPSPSHGDETAYLRSLVVEGTSGPQLLVDQVSSTAGEDPESLDVWDMAYGGPEGRAQVWAAIPLESAEDADEVADSRMHEVLRQMVGSYSPAIQ